MRIVIAGGSGQIGNILARSFSQRGDAVVILSRSPSAGHQPWRSVAWDGVHLGAWACELDGADVLINLAGRSVNCRYSRRNLTEILCSRVDSVRVLGEAIARSPRPPKVWLQASTATIYAHRFDAPNDEFSGLIGCHEHDAPSDWRFSVAVARAWEAELAAAQTPHTRKVALRSAMVMSPDHGGIFDTLLTLTRRGLGGAAAGGAQYVSWIHEHDFTRAVEWIISREHLAGAINLASPNPLPNSDFMRSLRGAAGVRFGLPASRWMLEAGALLLRTETELVLKSRRVTPARLLADGFCFDYPDWAVAAFELVDRCRRGRAPATAHGRASSTPAFARAPFVRSSSGPNSRA